MRLKRVRLAAAMALLCLSGSSFAQDGFIPSAKREKGQDWRETLSRLEMEAEAAGLGTFGGDTAYSLKVPFDQLDPASVPEWPSLGELTEAFERVREDRYLTHRNRPDFLRRISWLYPDDGCFARAAKMRDHFEEDGAPPVAKLFSMGNLTVETDNHPSGEVHWGWHVVPVARVGEVLYVFDPAIEPEAPLTAKEWALRQVDHIEDAEFAICNEFSYHPYSRCESAEPGDDDGSTRDQERYLQREWNRQEELGRDPEVVLGDAPPWRWRS